MHWWCKRKKEFTESKLKKKTRQILLRVYENFIIIDHIIKIQINIKKQKVSLFFNIRACFMSRLIHIEVDISWADTYTQIVSLLFTPNFIMFNLIRIEAVNNFLLD